MALLSANTLRPFSKYAQKLDNFGTVVFKKPIC